MESTSLQFLKDLLTAPSPSGYEGPVRDVWRAETGKYADHLETDLHGNVIAGYHTEGQPRIMLAGHCDELGFIIIHIDEQGFIFFNTLGGFDINIVPGRKVRIHSANGPILGVVGKKAIHLMSPEERKKTPETHELFIDIGARDRAEAESLVAIGDPISYDPNFEELRHGLVVSKTLDNKSGAFIVAEALRLYAARVEPPKAALFSVATVQEEIGLRGATTSAYGVDPTVGIAVDVTHAMDYPGTDTARKQRGMVQVDGGPVIVRGPHINPVVFDLLVQTAREMEMPYQVIASPNRTATDADAMQLTRAGIATGLVKIPQRYMHSPVEVVSLNDIEQAALLLAGFVERVDEDTRFIP